MTSPLASSLHYKDFSREIMIQSAQKAQDSGRQFTPQQLFTLPNQSFGETSNSLVLQMNYDGEFEVLC